MKIGRKEQTYKQSPTTIPPLRALRLGAPLESGTMKSSRKSAMVQRGQIHFLAM